MGVAAYNKTSNTANGTDGVNAGSSALPKDGSVALATGSLFVGGKITDNLGAFVQYTYDNYSSLDPVSGKWHGHSHSDNLDLRYADRWIGLDKDLIFGVTVNNNPTVQDVWNSAPAWTSPYVPNIPRGDAATNVGPTPLIYGLGQSVAGAGAYAYWNKLLYAELSFYQSADTGLKSLFSHGFETTDMTKISGSNPYWRLALNHEWGPHSAMLGLFGMVIKPFDDPADPVGPTNRNSDVGIDAQYQYILNPHAITVTASGVNEKIRYPSFKWDPNDPSYSAESSNATDTLRHTRLKASYVYRAKYGASLAYYDTGGSSNPLVFDPDGLGLAANPGTRIYVPEVFWLPVQNIRIGAQYWKYSELMGASANYAGDGRNAKDNDTLFIYTWAAY
ncbi:MAG: cytochrome C [Betaproteobacteria bacterium]|nr:MAG: cytochrome C [Betaproteobacteria bacterium]